MKDPKESKPATARPDLFHQHWTGSGRAVAGFDFFCKNNLPLALSVILLYQKQFVKQNFNGGEQCKIWKMNMQVHFTNCMYRKVIFIDRYKNLDRA